MECGSQSRVRVGLDGHGNRLSKNDVFVRGHTRDGGAAPARGTTLLTFPGVYVQEVPSGVRTIVGVSTSICSFVGRSRSGPLFRPKRIQTFTDFLRIFGDDPSVGDLSRYVRLFFLNGGTDCYVTRIANGAVASSVTLLNEAKAQILVPPASRARWGGRRLAPRTCSPPSRLSGWGRRAAIDIH